MNNGQDARGSAGRMPYGEPLDAAEGDGATLPAAAASEGFAVIAGETFGTALAAAFGAVVATGEPAAGGGDAVAAAGVGIPINSLCNALSLELR